MEHFPSQSSPISMSLSEPRVDVLRPAREPITLDVLYNHRKIVWYGTG